jgi:hypothetical protein
MEVSSQYDGHEAKNGYLDKEQEPIEWKIAQEEPPSPDKQAQLLVSLE